MKSIFQPNGLLSKIIPKFTPREAQQTMAEAVEKAIQLQTTLMVEAGTGTGKTFGYLIPVFSAQKKTIISTGTKNLQDQLFFKDIPIIKQLFTAPLKVVLLKGRANYLCLHRLENSLQEGWFSSRREVTELHFINEWSKETQKGDIAELSDLADDPGGVWPHITSTVDNCLSQECPFYKKCFVVKARQEAMEADIVIVNHHLFFADLRLQEEGFGELLPGADVVIFDEAHHLLEVATQFFSTRLSSRQLLELSQDSIRECGKEAQDMQALLDAASELQTKIQHLRDQFDGEIKRGAWPETLPAKLTTSIAAMQASLMQLEALLREAAIRSKGLENCWQRACQLLERFNLHTGETPADNIHWYETFAQHFSIHLTPLKIAEQFKNHLHERKRSWIFTSATLTVNNNFRLFAEGLGLEEALSLQLASPFDYQKQALLYVPRQLPDPHAEHYWDAMVDSIVPVLEASRGRAFVLLTSHKALEYVSALLKNRIAYPVLKQGAAAKRSLIEQFKQLGNAVLCATSGFWYGIDVRGDALSCVIIDKLPFASPSDPILKARIQHFKKQGIDPFYHHQLPNAVLVLKQGAGRLIRDHEDRGMLMICDPRLVGFRYGETFLASLPNMPRTRDFNKVSEFFAEL